MGLGLSETFGARHLGEPAGGRAEGWKSFTRTLDGLAFSAEEEAAVEKGAIDAFVRFTVLLEQAYASGPGTGVSIPVDSGSMWELACLRWR